MSKILITGATGLVGSALLPLFEAEDEIHAIARGPVAERLVPNLHVHQLDLSGEFDPSGLPARIDAVIYLAQSENFRDFPRTALDIFDVNVGSLMRLLDYARAAGARSFVYASSGGVYGSGATPIREDVPIAATGSLGFYLSTKLCGEILVENYAPFMSVAMLRLFFAYGRGQKRSMLIPRLIDNIRAGTPIQLQGTDGLHLNPVHAADAAAACRAALDLSGLHRINVAGPEPLSLRELCELIGDKVARRPVFEGQTEAGEANLVADTTAMASLLGPPGRRISDHIDELL